MDDFGGTKEEDEIQQAIRLSLQDLGMSYSHENQSQTNEDQVRISCISIELLYCINIYSLSPTYSGSLFQETNQKVKKL